MFCRMSIPKRETPIVTAYFSGQNEERNYRLVTNNLNTWNPNRVFATKGLPAYMCHG